MQRTQVGNIQLKIRILSKPTLKDEKVQLVFSSFTTLGVNDMLTYLVIKS